MNCETCKEKRQQAEPVSFQSHQADMARMERQHKHQAWCILALIALCVILASLLYAAHVKSEKVLLENNQKWIDMWMEYDFESYEYQQDGEGVNIIGSMNGVEYNGPTSESTTQSQKERIEQR